MMLGVKAVHRFGPWALVMGAPSGIGAEFVRQRVARVLMGKMIEKTLAKRAGAREPAVEGT
jgi:hypothetical protein